MDGHITAERISKIAAGTDLLTSEELAHVERCADCVNWIAESIRERIAQEMARKPSS